MNPIQVNSMYIKSHFKMYVAFCTDCDIVDESRGSDIQDVF